MSPAVIPVYEDKDDPTKLVVHITVVKPTTRNRLINIVLKLIGRTALVFFMWLSKQLETEVKTVKIDKDKMMSHPMFSPNPVFLDREKQKQTAQYIQ